MQLRWYSDHAMGCMISAAQFLTRARSSLLQNIQAINGTPPQPASYSVGNWGSYPRDKKVARE
jgi:hypothetical protein